MKSCSLVDAVSSMQAGIACGQRDDSGIVQLRLNNLLTNGLIDFSGHVRIPSVLVSNEMLLQPGDVLFNNTNSVELVGKTVVFQGYKENATFSNHVTRIRVSEDVLVPEYLAFWLLRQWQEKVFEGICDRWIGQAAVQRSKLEMLQVPIRPLNEQSQIAAKVKAQLADAEIARQAAVSQLQDTGILRTRVLAEIFNRLDSVETKVLGDFAHTTSGSTPSRGIKQYWEPAEIPWVKTGEVNFSTINATEESISKAALAECSLTLLPPQSVLVAMIGQGKTRGQSAFLNIEATTNQNCFAVFPNDTWEPEFLYYWFVSSYQYLRNFSADRGGNQSALNGAILRALKIPAPDKDEQLQIIQQVKTALSEIATMEQTSKTMLADIEQLPNRILAQAFEN